MANKNDYFYKQTVTEAELDSGFDKMETSIQKVMSDQLLQGIFQGAEVTQLLSPSLSVDVNGPSLIYDQLGRRVFWSPVQTLDCSVDENSNPTTVTGGGNAKVLSVFAQFDRLLSDPRIDGNSATVYFNRDEHFKLNVVQGAEATAGAEVAPALRVDQILLCDITILNGTTQIFDADIDLLTRRQDTFVLTGVPNSEREGTVKDVLQAFQDQINSFIGSALPATSITYSGAGNWADGTANPAVDVELQLDKIITDLAVGAGSAKIMTAAGPAWADGAANPAERLDQRIDSIITDLAVGAGAAKLAIAAGSAWKDATANPAERLDQRVDSIITDLVADNGADRIGVQASTNGIVTAGGSIHNAINELDVAIAGIPDPGIWVRRFPFHTTLGPGATSTNDMRVQLAASDKYHQPIGPLPDGEKVTGIVLYGEHSGASTVTVQLYKQTWGSVGGTVIGTFTTTAGIGNIVGSVSFAGVAIDGGANWFLRVTNDSAVDAAFLHSFTISTAT